MQTKLFKLKASSRAILFTSGVIRNMGRRFLNVKTKEIFLGDNAGKKINEVLEKYLPYQKVLIVTTSKLKKNEEKCYENLLKSIKTLILSIFLAKR